jgi:hypothetical protein
MKTAVWIFTLVGTVPVVLLATVLLVMHVLAAIAGPREGHYDSVFSIMTSDSSYVMSTHIWPLVVILAGASLLLFGVWRLLQH